jgi:hypothetical protein
MSSVGRELRGLDSIGSGYRSRLQIRVVVVREAGFISGGASDLAYSHSNIRDW